METASLAARRLAEGLRALGLDAALSAPLLAYLAELEKWNAAYNLTAVRDPAEMVTRHLMDCLALLPAIEGLQKEAGKVEPSLADIGSGAGLPGLILAIARPQWRIAVLDSNGKKARFLRHAVRRLALPNVEVVEGRAEDWRPEQRFDFVISRAFAALGDFVAVTAHLLARDGLWLAMKAKLADSELGEVSMDVAIAGNIPVAVPGLPETRRLVVLRRRGPEPA